MRVFRAVPMFVAALVAMAGAGQASAALVGTSISTGIAALKEWNLVAFNNFTTANHVDGRLLVGGNLNVNNGVVAMSPGGIPSSSYGTPSVTVVGNANFSNGNVNGPNTSVGGNLTGNFNNNGGGSVLVGGSAQNQQNFTVQGNQGASFTNTLASQSTDIKNSLTSLSANLKALTNTGNVTFNASDSNNQTLVSTATGLAVYNMTEAQFEGIGQNSQLLVTVPNGSTLVINVAGTDIDLAGKVNTFANMQNVVWNFYQATTIDLAQQFSGSVLGVFADITAGNSGNIDGTVVGNNITQNANGEIHNAYFQGDLSSLSGGGGVVSTAPEPSTWAMLILGFGLIGAAMRRRRQGEMRIQAA